MLCILFAMFLGIFALDVFTEGYGFWKTILALIMHLIPTFIVVILLVIAWRWEGIGAILFIFLPFFYLIMNKWRSWMISGPLLLVGVLFLLNWIYKEKLRT